MALSPFSSATELLRIPAPTVALPSSAAAASGTGLLSSLGSFTGPLQTLAGLGLSFGLSELFGGRRTPPPSPVRPESGGGGSLRPIPKFDADTFSTLLRVLAARSR